MVYERPPPKYPAESILKILCCPSLPASRICTTLPTHITSSATYVIDVTKLANPDDVKKDIFGVWSHSGSHPQACKVHVEEDGYVNVEKCDPGAKGDDDVYLRHLHSVHRPPFKQPVQADDCLCSGFCPRWSAVVGPDHRSTFPDQRFIVTSPA